MEDPGLHSSGSPEVEMLLLSSLHNLLQQVLSLPELHTAVLFTPEGHLVSYASYSSKPKDEIRVLVGVSGEVWQETKQHGIGMVDGEVCVSCTYFGGFELTVAT